MRPLKIIVISLILTLLPQQIFAHAEHEKARFVAPTGKDVGQCENVLRPCKSIGYAVQQANKGDKVLVAAGQYNINNSSELFYLKSLVVPILGGYNRFDHFESQSPDTNITLLHGVPIEMAQELRNKGFTIISDGKSLAKYQSLKTKLDAYYQLAQSQKNTPCVNGKAGAFDCENVDLLAHVPLGDFSSNPSAANDVWGHIDLNTMREYALIGLNNGVAVIDVTDPINPTEVGTVRGANSIWRDIKVYQYFDESLNIWRAYAYSTIDSTPDRVNIIDLNNLPNSVSLTEKNNAVGTAHNVYISNIDHSLNIALPGLTPSLQLIGTNKFGGAFHNYSLQNPATLSTFSNLSSGNGYTHDGASMVINDDRSSSDCVNKTTPCTIFFDFNEKEMKLWDITDPSKVVLISTGLYFDVSSSFQYVHSGWPTEDKNYVFVHDEFDEKDAGINSTVRVFSITDLKKPTHVAQWTGPTKAIDHNGFVRGNRYYLSNYERGLSVLDISNPLEPTQIGFFDTFTPSNNANYNGAWGAYPFLPSGNLLISDIDSGLYILKDNTTDSSQGSIHFEQAEISTEQGTSLYVSVLRSNITPSATSTSVGYELIPGSAKETLDYTPVTGELSWQNNANDNQTITIDIAPENTNAEYEESFFVRLFNPTNGATLSSPSYLKVNINGLIDSGALGFTTSTLTVAENSGLSQLQVARVGSSTGITTINYQLDSSTQANSAEENKDFSITSGQLTWQDGDTSNKIIPVTIIDDNEDENTETFTIKLSSENNSRIGANSTVVVSITDDDNNTAPSVVLEEDKQVNSSQTVTITSTATDAENDAITYLWQQTAGAIVELSSTNESSTSFVAPSSSGLLTFNLTATDIKGASNSDTISITVIAPTPVETPKPANKSGGSIYWLMLLLSSTYFLRKQNILLR